MKQVNGVWYEVANFATKTTRVRITAELVPANAAFRVQGNSGPLQLGPPNGNKAILEFPITQPPGAMQIASFLPNFVDHDPEGIELKFSLEEIVDGTSTSSFPDAYILKKKDVLGSSNPDLPHTFIFFIV